MDDAAFWRIIAASLETWDGKHEAQLASIRNQLGALAPAEVIDFDRILDEKIDAAYRWDLWGAAYLINGGCSDDGFRDFRAWLISQGEQIYARAIEQPDTLADVSEPGDDYWLEDLLYLTPHVYEERTGSKIPRSDVGAGWPADPTGVHWDFDDPSEQQRRLPRLVSLHGN